VYTVMNLRVPQNAGNFLSSSGRFSFSGRTLLHGVSKCQCLCGMSLLRAVLSMKGGARDCNLQFLFWNFIGLYLIDYIHIIKLRSNHYTE
jgi:hypothetical protein